MAKSMKTPPAYAPSSVDHALRLAQILQLDGAITVSAAAERLGVARSTAHRLLAALVYRDFAVRDEDRTYRVGPILALAERARSDVGALRVAALGPMRALVDRIDETVNLSIRTGRTVRFIASVECARALRVDGREGMVFPAHQASGGLITLAALSDEELETLYAGDERRDLGEEPPDLARLRLELRAVRRSGVALNLERTERGVVAVGRAVKDRAGATVAALSISMPSVRYTPDHLTALIAALTTAVDAIARTLRGADPDGAVGPDGADGSGGVDGGDPADG
ncbi:transcriptional regulator [Sphaerisporangium siamense]|uniref:DNA-binding IclR family transcriptional regulator n=1 Tax=Sphaerisporangium siamense TaxID=795645 RepID=A0A7W7G8I4_9ACTN|nr:IclR family transcriptional regulator [Sphaerisporangium siamense]MBB4699549.1 DNA-binding IclR family transcriptional regulator [Sphaerisporangium siamense]GII86963.1 transcriptional regulator [Sphaerisporangium siamense]